MEWLGRDEACEHAVEVCMLLGIWDLCLGIVYGPLHWCLDENLLWESQYFLLLSHSLGQKIIIRQSHKLKQFLSFLLQGLKNKLHDYFYIQTHNSEKGR